MYQLECEAYRLERIAISAFVASCSLHLALKEKGIIVFPCPSLLIIPNQCHTSNAPEGC